MANKIFVLSESVSNQIAAGEVVSRPAAVVKELMENSIDAGATSVDVIIKDGGRELIHVIDNGSGMSKDDLATAFERHATSKIKSILDIYKLSSFGFRGEALPSIASIAEVEVKTKQQAEQIGSRIIINGGELIRQEEVSCPVGTQFIVKNLFYNTPARRKFLKNNSVETRHILNEFQRVALVNPNVAFSFINNGQQVHKLEPSNLRQRITSLMGKSVGASLLELEVDTSIVSVSGFIGKPEASKKSGSEQFLFVNGRFFKSRYLFKAIANAYERLVKQDSQPTFFLYMTIDPSRIDVNISPSKTEVKFEDEKAVWQILNAAVRETLAKLGSVPLLDFEVEDPLEIPVLTKDKPFKQPTIDYNPYFNPFEKEESNYCFDSSKDNFFINKDSDIKGWEDLYPKSATEKRASAIGAGEVVYEDIEAFESIDVIEYTEEDSTLFEFEETYDYIFLPPNYIGYASGNKLNILNIRNAYARILYERFCNLINNSESANQQELFPIEMDISLSAAKMLDSIKEDLFRLGFDIEINTKEGKIQISGMPVDSGGLKAKEIFEEILSELELHGEIDISRKKETLALSMTKAYMRGFKFSFTAESAEHIIAELNACKEPKYSPFGKPTIIEINKNELDKRFS